MDSGVNQYIAHNTRGKDTTEKVPERTADGDDLQSAFGNGGRKGADVDGVGLLRGGRNNPFFVLRGQAVQTDLHHRCVRKS